ncbi:MAG: hypothetical protein JNK77_17885 [Saprospiraceae bacterium]|nr:hypothetical protein [Saprospiraceae bacterium]
MKRSKEEFHLLPGEICRQALDKYNLDPTIDNAVRLINFCYECHHVRGALFGFILSKVDRDQNVANDIYIVTMTKFYRWLVNQQRPIRNLWGFLKRIAFNETLKFWDQKRNIKGFSAYIDPFPDPEDIKDDDLFSMLLNHPTAKENILLAINPFLSPREFELLGYQVANCYSNEKIAEIMGVKIDYIYNLSWQVLKKIKLHSQNIRDRLSGLED